MLLMACRSEGGLGGHQGGSGQGKRPLSTAEARAPKDPASWAPRAWRGKRRLWRLLSWKHTHVQREEVSETGTVGAAYGKKEYPGVSAPVSAAALKQNRRLDQIIKT